MREMVREFYGAIPERYESYAMTRGTALERVAAYDYWRETGRDLEDGGFHVHPDHDWVAVSPDRLVGDDGGLEIKAPMGEPEPPHPWYEDQCRLGMECTFRDWWDLYQWTATTRRTDVFFHDPRWLPSILPELEGFMGVYYRLTENESLAADHLMPGVFLRNDAEWRRVASTFRYAAAMQAKAKEQYEAAREALIKETGGYSTEGCGVRVTKTGNGWRVK